MQIISEGTFGGLSGPGDNSGGNMGIGGGPGMGPGSGRCGNGYVDEGEDCDCGSDPTCASNPCCSSYTCRLNIDAQCSSGECCQNCKVSFFYTYYLLLKREFSLSRFPSSSKSKEKEK